MKCLRYRSQPRYHSKTEKTPFAVADFYKYWWDLTDKEASKYLKRLQGHTA